MEKIILIESSVPRNAGWVLYTATMSTLARTPAFMNRLSKAARRRVSMWACRWCSLFFRGSQQTHPYTLGEPGTQITFHFLSENKLAEMRHKNVKILVSQLFSYYIQWLGSDDLRIDERGKKHYAFKAANAVWTDSCPWWKLTENTSIHKANFGTLSNTFSGIWWIMMNRTKLATILNQELSRKTFEKKYLQNLGAFTFKSNQGSSLDSHIYSNHKIQKKM